MSGCAETGAIDAKASESERGSMAKMWKIKGLNLILPEEISDVRIIQA